MQEALNAVLIVLPLMVLFLIFNAFFKAVRRPKRLITEHNGLKKISTNPSYFFGGSRSHYYYDHAFLYEIKNDITINIPLCDIVQIKPGYTKINNRQNWLIIYLNKGERKQVEFFNNLTFFNHNFPDFLKLVKQANPDADIKNLSFFNL